MNLYMKTKIEKTKRPFCLQEVGGCFFPFTTVIRSRNCMCTY